MNTNFQNRVPDTTLIEQTGNSQTEKKPTLYPDSTQTIQSS